MLNGNEVFDANGWCELHMPPYSTRILVVNDGSFRPDLGAEVVTVPVEDKAEEGVQPGQKYRYFKGGEYEVTGLAKHSESGEELVIYRSVQQPDVVWARPYSMFTETVWKDGRQVKRFEKL